MTDALRPAQWDDYIGQEELKARLSIHIEAANRQHRALEHVLLDGRPGTGKTSLAALIASQLNFDFVPFMMPMATEDLFRVVMNSHCAVIFLDEIHRMRPSQQEDLLYPVEDGTIKRRWGTQPIEGTVTFIGATTEPHKVIKPLRERFMINPRFKPYTNNEMATIVEKMGMKVEIPFTNEEAMQLGVASAGLPRQAKRLVLAARDCGNTNVSEILSLAGITPEGLTEEHIEYLNILYSNSNGYAGIKVLATMLQLSEASVADLEDTLLRLDMIEYTPRGRSLKGAGYNFLTRKS